MNDEINVTVLTVTKELEIHNHYIVEQLKHKKTGDIATYFLHCEHIPAVFASKTCHWVVIETLTFHKTVGWPDKPSCVEKLEDGEEEADHDGCVIWNSPTT